MYGTICMKTDRVEKRCSSPQNALTGTQVNIDTQQNEESGLHALAMTIEAHADKEGA